MGNGPLAEYLKKELESEHEIIFHAHDKSDLDTVKKLKLKNPDAYGILASFGVIIKPDLLNLFEPEGIINVHPSFLPEYRGPSPIETAIKNGDCDFGVSIMKLVKEMDAGPIYFQMNSNQDTGDTLPATTEDYPTKDDIYRGSAEVASYWLNSCLDRKNLSPLEPQDNSRATYTTKLDKSMSPLDTENKNALELLCEIRAFQDFPKSTAKIYGKNCIIHSAHVPIEPSELDDLANHPEKYLVLHCKNGTILFIDELQPENKNRMTAKAFLNGYKH